MLARNRAVIAAAVFVAAAAYLLWSEHRPHFLDALPFLVLLACPLMHLFMHGGHEGREPGRGEGRGTRP